MFIVISVILLGVIVGYIFRNISFLTRKNISASLSTETTIKSLSINKIGGDLICLDNGVLSSQIA